MHDKDKVKVRIRLEWWEVQSMITKERERPVSCTSLECTGTLEHKRAA